jgi:dihydroorotate dehydrogenase (NAD+) catalytic subunit
MVNSKLKIKLLNLELDNPIIPASGTFGYGFDHAKYFDINILGSIATKAITLEPRFGNSVPRICEVASGMINSIGLQNKGVEHIIANELQLLNQEFKKPVLVNIAGTEIDHYVKLVTRLNVVPNIGIYEVNVSCPNVEQDGLKFNSNPNDLTKLVKELKKVATKPLFIKLSPQVTDITEMAIAAEQAGADGLVLINTIPGMRIDIASGKPIVGNKIGGVSGPTLKPIALRAVYLCSQVVKIPIIGCGGISTAEDVIEMMYAGATAVEVGAENLVNPYACKEIIESLPSVMKKLKINDLKDIVGKSHE